MPGEDARPRVLQRPSRTDSLLIVVGVLGVSTSAPLIKAAAAPTLAIAFWRNAFGSGVVVPWALWRARDELRAMSREERKLSLLAGVLLAAHFATWIPSLAFTSVASSVALVAVQPVWAALLARSLGERMARAAWAGIALSVVGALVLTGVDFTISARALIGDGLALVGGMLAAAYVTVGARVRRTVSTSSYTAIAYLTAALALLVVCLVGGVRMGGYAAEDWWRIVALTVLAQLLGHSVFNRVLRTTSPTVVSISILFEIVGAAVLAALFIGERPPLAALPAAVLIAAGVVVVVRAGEHEPAVSAAPPLE